MRRKLDRSHDAVTLVQLYFHVYETMTLAIADILAELELSQSQAGLLWNLAPGSPPAGMRELARKLHCDPSNVTLMADRLEQAGLVERRTHPTDGRRRILALTNRGTRAWNLIIARLEQRSPLFTSLTAEEREQLAELLTKAQAATGPT